MLRDGKLFVEQVKSSTRTPLVSVMLHGGSRHISSSPVTILTPPPLRRTPRFRKDGLAATIAQVSEFPFIKFVSPDSMVGFSEAQKINAIHKVFSDSYKSFNSNKLETTP
jgi:vesicle-fusing ATPase